MTAAVPTPDEVGGRLLPLDRRNAAQQIADRVVTAIALGEFVEGQRLPAERELARMLGTARPTIREALQRLESQGFVAVHRGRNGGAVVQPFDWPAARDAVRQTLLPTWAEFEVLFDFRTLIEGLVAATAATRRTPGDLSAIESALDAYRGASDSRESSRSADEALHRAIADRHPQPLPPRVVGRAARQGVARLPRRAVLARLAPPGTRTAPGAGRRDRGRRRRARRPAGG